MYINKERVRCGSIASAVLLAISLGASCPSTFLPWWDLGSSKELFNLDEAPGVVSSLWSFEFRNPPPWVALPRPRAPSTWEEYCERDEASSGGGDDAAAATDSKTSEANSMNSNSSSNSTNSNTTTASDSRRMSAGVSHSHGRTLQTWSDEFVRTTPAPIIPPDPPLPASACHLMRITRMMMILASSFGLLAVIVFAIARWKISLAALLVGSALAMLSAMGAGAGVVIAGLFSTSGLASALGTQSALLGLFFAMAGACLAVYTSTKALQEPPKRQLSIGGEAEEEDAAGDKHHADLETGVEDDGSEVPRLTRIRRARDRERRKLTTQAMAAGMKGLEKGGHHETSERKKAEMRKAIEEAIPKTLLRVLRWGEGPNEGGRFGDEIPDEMLEAAFMEIDVDESGSITVEEFMNAVRHCGLEPSEGAFKIIMQKVDNNNDGTLDQLEFVNFVRKIEESLKDGIVQESQANLCVAMCQFCFCVHVIFIAVTVILSVRQEDEGDAAELNAVKRAERELVQTLLKAIGVSFCFLFWCVVGLPLLHLSIGSAMKAWIAHFKAAAKKRRENTRRAHERPGERDIDQEEGEDVSPSGSKSPQSPSGSKSTPADNENDGSEVTPEGTMTPVSTGVTMTTLGTGTSSKSGARRKTRMTTRASTTVIELPWWKRALRKLQGKGAPASRFSKASRKSRKTRKTMEVGSMGGWKGQAEGQYNPAQYKDANLRAMAALSSPVSTFTPMQVRNLLYHPPDMTLPVPPQEVFAPSMYLPGTPDNFHQDSSREHSASGWETPQKSSRSLKS